MKELCLVMVCLALASCSETPEPQRASLERGLEASQEATDSYREPGASFDAGSLLEAPRALESSVAPLTVQGCMCIDTHYQDRGCLCVKTECMGDCQNTCHRIMDICLCE